jgi:hypothetical protein
LLCYAISHVVVGVLVKKLQREHGRNDSHSAWQVGTITRLLHQEIHAIGVESEYLTGGYWNNWCLLFCGTKDVALII